MKRFGMFVAPNHPHYDKCNVAEMSPSGTSTFKTEQSNSKMHTAMEATFKQKNKNSQVKYSTNEWQPESPREIAYARKKSQTLFQNNNNTFVATRSKQLECVIISKTCSQERSQYREKYGCLADKRLVDGRLDTETGFQSIIKVVILPRTNGRSDWLTTSTVPKLLYQQFCERTSQEQNQQVYSRSLHQGSGGNVKLHHSNLGNSAIELYALWFWQSEISKLIQGSV